MRHRQIIANWDGPSHRRALMRSMVTSLFQAERITTTAPKAKEARRFAERLITRARRQEGARRGQTHVALRTGAARCGGPQYRRRRKLHQLALHFMERNGGYTRIIRSPHAGR
jgi:large subunit ribosomal protein L17